MTIQARCCTHLGLFCATIVGLSGCEASVRQPADGSGNSDSRVVGDPAADGDVVPGDAPTAGDTLNPGDTGPAGDTTMTGDGVAACSGVWSSPESLVQSYGRLAIGIQVHVVGHVNGEMVHRTSLDDGLTWSDPTVIAPAAGNYPGMYGGFFAEGDSLYLFTAPADMASSVDVGGRQLDFRKSTDNGSTWTDPVRITDAGQGLFRGRIAASGNYVHVAGVSAPTPDASVVYIRSTDGGTTWEDPVVLAQDLGTYGGGQTVAVDGATVHVAYTTAYSATGLGLGAGPTSYIRSLDNGATWSTPVSIGEDSPESYRQARVQLSAADGRIVAVWQREGEYTGATVPADRIGYNTSDDGGATWGTARILPNDLGVNRNHQHVWMASGGGTHVLWRIGDSSSDPAGVMHSFDYGATWGPSTEAINSGGINHPWNIVADQTAVHVITGPDTSMLYARRCLP